MVMGKVLLQQQTSLLHGSDVEQEVPHSNL